MLTRQELQVGLGTEPPPPPRLLGMIKITTRNNGQIFLSPADDTTRVLLQGNEDYINASYVNVSWEPGGWKRTH